jgi:hypothetical protein
MKLLISLSAFIFFASPAMADNFATCILDRMPKSQNDAATRAIMKVCLKKYPKGYEGIFQGSGTGWFGYDSGAECAAEKAANTSNTLAGRTIYIACKCLYDPPNAPSAELFLDWTCKDQQNTH